MNEEWYEWPSQAQATFGKEQRWQCDYLIRNVNGDPFKRGSIVWLFEPRKAKSRESYLAWLGPYERLIRTSEVTYGICKRGRTDRWTKVHFKHLKPYIGELEVRCSKRKTTRPKPMYEEFPNASDRIEEKFEDCPFHVFRNTAAETHSKCNISRVTFKKLTFVINKMKMRMTTEELLTGTKKNLPDKILLR